MKERPILFSAPMVRALLAGTKTQTRRVVKPQPHHFPSGQMVHLGDANWAMNDGDLSGLWSCPYGQPGDRLWVRETWRHIEGGTVYDAAGGVADSFDPETIYRADRPNYPGPWKPSIHMPRWASRITLEVTGMRVERLQDISEADSIAEGIGSITVSDGGAERWINYAQPESKSNAFGDPCRSYRSLWESINGPSSWDANTWVWVIEVKRLEGGAA